MPEPLHDDTYYYTYYNNVLYVGGENTSIHGNGAYNKEIVEAYLPSFYLGIKIYGTRYRCLAHLSKLETVIIPRTYKIIGGDLCLSSTKVKSIVFEENSELREIGGWFAGYTTISTFTFPSSLKIIGFNYFFQGCNNLETIIYAGNIECVSNDIFDQINVSKIKVYTRKNYKYDSFCGAKVINVLNSPIKAMTCKIKQTNYHGSRLSLLGFLILV